MRTLATIWGLILAAPLLVAQNAGFENGLVGWSSSGSGSWSATTTAGQVRSGSKSALLTSCSTTSGKLSNAGFTITIPVSGAHTVTVIGWVKANVATNFVAVGGSDGVTEHKGAEVTLPAGAWTHVTHTFSATNNATYHPILYGRSSTGAAVSLAFDDIVIYHGTLTVADLSSPGSAAGVVATPGGTQIPLAWTPGVDSAAGSGIAGVLVLRRGGAVAGDLSVSHQTRYSASDPLVGPTTVGGWTVAYNGTQTGAFTDDPGAPGVYTYLVFMRDSAYNYSTGEWAGARIFVFNGTGLSTSTPVNTRLDGLYLPATCTFSSEPASTVTIRAGATITVHGSVINRGNVYVRSDDLPPAQVTFAAGSVYDFNRNGTSTGAEFFSLIDATWLPGSTCKVTGVTNLLPLGLDQTFANLMWDCPSQSLTDTLGTASGPTIVNGTFTLINTGTGGVHLSSVPGPNRFRGDVSIIGGTLDAGGGADPVFDGTSPQHLTAGGGVIAGALSATLDNPSGLALGSNLSLTTLTLVNGVVSTGTNTLTIVPGGTVNRTNGHVAGFLRKHVSTGSPSLVFETGDASRYAPMTLSFANVAASGNLTGSTTPGDHPNIASSGLNPALTVNRYYSIVNSGVAFDTATVALYFDPSDVDPSADPGHFVVRKYDAPQWSSTGNGARTAASVVAKNITSFSDFAVGEGDLYTITTAVVGGGTIDPAGPVTVVGGDDQGFAIAANADNRIDSVVVDGGNVGPLGAFTFHDVSANHAIVAWCSPNTHTISALAGPYGSITPSGSVAVSHGADRSFIIAPDTGAHIDSVVVDAVNQGVIDTYTFTNVTTDHAIHAYFSMNVYTITATAGPNGSITPAGAVAVAYGGVQLFTIIPDTGAHIDSVVVDAVNQGAITAYTFTNVAADHVIRAFFSSNVYTITATAGPHGSITPAGAVAVAYGGVQSFTITPDTGAHIDSVVVDGVNQGGIGTYAFANVTADHAIHAYFSLNVYTITATAGPHGSITPAGTVGVTHGDSQSFTVLADPGYHIDSVVVDGVNQGMIATYTFTAVVSNHTIAAYFSGGIYTITATAGGGGTISPAGVLPVSYGGTVTFTVTPDVYYHNDSVLVDGVNQGAISTYTFSGVTSNHSISAHFTIDIFRFLSMTPDTVFNEEPIRRGRSIKPVLRGKGRYPNWSNLLDETVAQGGFAPGTSESDSAGGAVIGISHMEKVPTDRLRPRWKVDRDSASTRAWVRLNGWDFARGVGRGFVATRCRTFQRSLGDRTGRHTGPPRGFSTLMFGSERYMHGQFRSLAPKRHNNKLFAELVALKLNIATSQLGKTPPGFGDLVFAVEGHPLNGMSILEISRKADTMMTYWQGHHQEEYDSLWSALSDINRAFVGPLDTIRFEQPDSFFIRGTLELKGHVAIGDIPFLRMPLPFVPTRITPADNAVESEEEFADDEYGDDEEESGQPVAARLYQNYPNPFNPSTTIGFRLQEASVVTIRVYTTLGQEIGALAVDEEFEEGYNEVRFSANGGNADGLASGVYFYRIDAKGVEGEGSRTVETRRMVLLK